MSDDFGHALRELRQRAKLSLAELAARTNYSKPMLAKVEVGDRRPSLDLATACDRALGTTPLLAMLCEYTGGDELRRRALVAGVGLLATGAVTGFDGLAEAVRHGLSSAAGVDDWDDLVAGHARDLVTVPGAEYGPRVLADLNLLLQLVRDGDAGSDQFRAAAGLGNFFGLWNGNRGRLDKARDWYRTAANLADRSGDTILACYIRGRAAARATYEGATVAETEAAIAQIMAVTGGTPSVGTLEAYSTEATLAGLIGEPERGRAAVRGMWRVAEALPVDADPWGAAGPAPRAAFLDAFVECRCGTLATAQRAVDTALVGLGDWPMWEAEVHQYWARALVAAGDVAEGVRYGLDAARRVQHDAQVIRIAARDVVDQVPAGWISAELEQLRGYASPDPGPWETLA